MSKSPPITIRREELHAAIVQQLIHALDSEVQGRYPEDGSYFSRLDAEEVAEGCGGFFVAYRNGEAIGCGAVRGVEPGVMEIKRMYVAPAARGQRVGHAILDALEAEARRLGARRLLLETGPRQAEAIALYERAGFTHIPLYGEYAHSPHPHLSTCMGKDL